MRGELQAIEKSASTFFIDMAETEGAYDEGDRKLDGVVVFEFGRVVGHGGAIQPVTGQR